MLLYSDLNLTGLHNKDRFDIISWLLIVYMHLIRNNNNKDKSQRLSVCLSVILS